MSSVNKVILVGHLGRDPETRYMPNGEAVTNLAIATSETWKDKNSGDKKESVEWHRVTMYRKLAEVAGQYLKKGSLIYLEGKNQTRKWTDKDGVERYTTEVIADTMQMLGSKTASEPSSANPAPSETKPRTNDDFADLDSDIPF